MKRMPNSIREKAQISIEPKAIGVKMKSKMRVYLINWLSIVLDRTGIPYSLGYL